MIKIKRYLRNTLNYNVQILYGFYFKFKEFLRVETKKLNIDQTSDDSKE